MALVTNVEVGPLYGVRHLVHSNTFVGHSLTKMVILAQTKMVILVMVILAQRKRAILAQRKSIILSQKKKKKSSLFHFVMIIMVSLNPQGQQIVTSFQFYKLEQQAIIIFHFVLCSKSSR